MYVLWDGCENKTFLRDGIVTFSRSFNDFTKRYPLHNGGIAIIELLLKMKD
jgi:hypothetical protein